MFKNKIKLHPPTDNLHGQLSGGVCSVGNAPAQPVCVWGTSCPAPRHHCSGCRPHSSAWSHAAPPHGYLKTGDGDDIKIVREVTLIHWPLGDMAVILKVLFSNSLYRKVAWAFTVEFLSGECSGNVIYLKIGNRYIPFTGAWSSNELQWLHFKDRTKGGYSQSWPQGWYAQLNSAHSVHVDPNPAHLLHPR